MANCGDFLKSQFPLIDEELKKYVEGNLGYKTICFCTRFLQIKVATSFYEYLRCLARILFFEHFERTRIRI